MRLESKTSIDLATKKLSMQALPAKTPNKIFNNPQTSFEAPADYALLSNVSTSKLLQRKKANDTWKPNFKKEPDYSNIALKLDGLIQKVRAFKQLSMDSTKDRNSFIQSCCDLHIEAEPAEKSRIEELLSLEFLENVDNMKVSL